MKSPQIELRHLASFVLACQNPTIAEAAAELGVSASTLSVSLHTLERELEVKLFQRQGGWLRPLPAAFWLFQQAMPLLHAESAARHALAGGGPIVARLHVQLDLSFTIGRFSKAVSRTIEAMRVSSPELGVDFDFRDGSDPSPSPGATSGVTETVLEIGYFAPGSDTGETNLALPLIADRWVVVGATDVEANGPDADAAFMLVRMRRTLTEQVMLHARRHGFADRLTPVDAEPADLGERLAANPAARFVLPQSMLADRLGLGRTYVVPLDPPLSSPVSARCHGGDPAAARAFLDQFRTALLGAEANAAFDPVLTMRQLRAFTLIGKAGGISAAARTANVTQPSLSSQVQRMEAALGQPLFNRTRTGMDLSAPGRRLLPLALDLEARLDRILRARKDVAAHTQSALVIGMLPSSGHDSAMTGRVAAALIALRAHHPECRLRLVEGANAALHEAVKAGELNLAIVGAVLGSLPHLVLGPSERLSVIAHPALGLAARLEMSIREVCALPLVLGPRHLSIHRAFVEAASAARLPVHPVMEVGSLPLAIAMTRRAPLATILPASSVRQDLEEGRLTATRLGDDLGLGTLSIIFSGERSLSDSERALVRELTEAFARPASP